MDKLFLELLNLSIAASWLILVVLLLRPMLKRAPRAIVCALWLLVGLRLALPFSIESALSLIPSRETVSPEMVYAAQPMIDSGVKILDQAVNPVIVESFAPSPAESVNPLQVLNFVGGCVWLMGLVLMLGYSAVSYLRLRLRVREAVLVEKGVRQGQCVASPFVLGFFRPCIYLPGGLSEEDRPMVLAHERAHIRRGDHWVKALGFLLLAVYWFNPLVWLSYVLLCRDIELACDEKVLKELGQGAKKCYSTALLNCSYSHRAVAACPLAFGELGVKTRIKSVLRYKKPAFWVTVTALILCLAVAVCFLTDPVAEPAPAAESPAPNAAAQAQGSQPQPLAAQPAPTAVPNDEFTFLIPKAGQGENYAPASLAELENRPVDARIAGSLEGMLADCRAAGHTVAVFRAYESYADAKEKFANRERWSEEEYWEMLRTATKRELQTGLSVLLATYEDGENYRANPLTDEDQFQAELSAWYETVLWLKEHAPDYGFIQRWPENNAEVTGKGTPGMFRYVGQDMARYLAGHDLCIEGYLMLAQAADAAQGRVELLSTSVNGIYYTAYVNISPVEKEDLLVLPGDTMTICAAFSPAENSMGLVNAQIMRDEYNQPLFYDEQTKTLRVSFPIYNYKETLGDTWPLEMTVRMACGGRILPSPGSFLLPAPVEEKRSIRFDGPLAYKDSQLENPVYITGVELSSSGAAWLAEWADMERYYHPGVDWNALPETEREWIAQVGGSLFSATTKTISGAALHFRDGSQFEISDQELCAYMGNNQSAYYTDWPSSAPIDINAVTAITIGGQTISLE